MKISAFFKKLRAPIVVSVVLCVICGLIYPLVMTGLSKVIFPKQSNGSLVEADGRVIGSELIGQDFTKPYFLKGRPSAVHYNTYTTDENGQDVYLDGSEFSGVASGSYNYGASDKNLAERVSNDIDAFLAANPGVKKEDIPTDLLSASGSGLDPHISPASAQVQLAAVSEASGLSVERLQEIVKSHTKGKVLGLFGEETVNVLLVNLDIAKDMGLLD